MTRLFTIRPEITAVIAANDNMAIGAYNAARKRGRGNSILISGFDNSAAVQPYLESGAVFMSVDQQVGAPSAGLMMSLMHMGKQPYL